jgi:prepilin-type processing-associated H-X9-DG protein
VIAIIAILAGMLLPALTAARQKARSIQCAGNLRQCMLAMNMYFNDFDETYPWSRRASKVAVNQYAWHQALTANQYLPANPDSPRPACATCPSVSCQNITYLSSYGSRVTGQDPRNCIRIKGNRILISNWDSDQYSIADVFNDGFKTENLIILGDSWQNNQDKELEFLTLDQNNSANASNALPGIRHSKHGNFVFIDGHAAAISGPDLIYKFQDAGAPYKFDAYISGNVIFGKQ